MDPGIHQTLLDVSQKLGQLTAECQNTNALLLRHMEDDKDIGNRIDGRLAKLELTSATQRGGFKVVAVLSTAIAALVAFAVETWFRLRS